MLEAVQYGQPLYLSLRMNEGVNDPWWNYMEMRELTIY